MELRLWYCEFRSCKSEQDGGALSLQGKGIKLTVQSCSFSSNKAVCTISIETLPFVLPIAAVFGVEMLMLHASTGPGSETGVVLTMESDCRTFEEERCT